MVDGMAWASPEEDALEGVSFRLDINSLNYQTSSSSTRLPNQTSCIDVSTVYKSLLDLQRVHMIVLV